MIEKVSAQRDKVQTASLLVTRLSWLRQQQLKLAARRDERNPGKLWRQETGNRVIGELRSLQRGRLRHDGYASDSAVLDDDDDTWVVHSTSGQVRNKTNFLSYVLFSITLSYHIIFNTRIINNYNLTCIKYRRNRNPISHSFSHKTWKWVILLTLVFVNYITVLWAIIISFMILCYIVIYFDNHISFLVQPTSVIQYLSSVHFYYNTVNFYNYLRSLYHDLLLIIHNFRRNQGRRLIHPRQQVLCFRNDPAAGSTMVRSEPVL